MSENPWKIVNFYEYCPSCCFYGLPMIEEPCYSCLGVTCRENSAKPENYIPKKEARHIND